MICPAYVIENVAGVYIYCAKGLVEHTTPVRVVTELQNRNWPLKLKILLSIGPDPVKNLPG